jgi:hypothetical protein
MLFATGIIIIIGVAMLSYSRNISLEPLDGTVFANTGDGVYIEQLQLGSGSSYRNADSIPVFVYRGRIYVRNERDPLALDVAKQLQGEKVGTTKNSLSDWGDSSNSSNSLPSNMGVSSIYMVSGYDSRFRLMTIDEESQIGWMYECLNNVYITDGACLFEKLGLKENIESATYQTLEEWNSSSDVFHEVTLDDEFWNLIDSLYTAKLIDYGRDTKPNLYEKERQVYYLTMKDQTVNEIIVFHDGYVAYQNLGAYYVFDLE